MRLQNLGLLDKFTGFLEGESVDEFFSTFDIKFSSGTWAAGGFSDRFMSRGYSPDLPSDVKSRIERIWRAGIRGFTPINVEFLDAMLKVNWQLVEEVLGLSKSKGMEVAGLALDLAGVPLLKLGSLTNPDPSLRKKSFEILVDSMDIAKMLGVDVVSFWPGQDGWDYSFEVNYGKKLGLFVSGIRELADEASKRGLKLSLEAKLKEPKEGNMIMPTTYAAVAIAKKVNEELGKNVVGITIDFGHELMYAVEPAFAVHFAKLMDVPLLAIHINTAKAHSNDEDRVVGTGDLWQLVDFLLATIETGYSGWFVLDQFTYRMDPVEGLRLSKELFANAMKKALFIYRQREELEKAREIGDQVKVLDIVKKALYNI